MVIRSGKLRAQSAKSMKFKDGYMISSSQPIHEYRGFAVRHLLLRQDSHNQAGIVYNGGLVPLLKLLDSKNGCLQHNAAFALYGIAENEDNVSDFIKVGGVQKLQDSEFINQVC
ncbi:unnamed protein product [Musa acuminata subsp. burmannicoides]